MQVCAPKLVQITSLFTRRSFCFRSSILDGGGSSYQTCNALVDVGQPTPATHPQLLMQGEITPGISREEYVSRRKKLLKVLPEKGLAIIAAASVKMMTDVVPYTFRQDSDYLYITGCNQPGGVAVLDHECGLCMFMPDATSNDVAWRGPVAGVDAALGTFKADTAYPMSKFQDILPGMIRRSSKVFYNGQTSILSCSEMEELGVAFRHGKVNQVSPIIHELRWVKSPAEIKLMKEAASIACQALLQTMLLSKRCPFEHMLATKVEYECKMRGAERMAFNPVVGGGSNGSIIHYYRNDQEISQEDLVLMDVGCELHGYASDLTRTWPVGGCFTSLQKELYELILQTNDACVKLCVPGSSLRKIHDYSDRMLREGLEQIGLLKDPASDLYHQLNPTAIGHFLGMDVHDSSSISIDRPFKPGVVITIEPGIYISPMMDRPSRFPSLGIRIEDEVLITDDGCEVLTGSMPKKVDHIETLLNNHSL